MTMLYFKDSGDGYYEFADDAPPEWYAHLAPTSQQLPTPLEANAVRLAKIDAEILAIEAKAIRPMRDALAALAAGTQPDPADTLKIQELTDAIKALRAERAGL
jgi:hypothetical protein